MCGIGGIVRWGQLPIKEDVLAILLVGNEHRGNDAAGLVIQQADGSLNVLKKDCPGWKLIATDEYEKFIKEHLRADSRSVLVHARAASRGNPRDNNNNHPIYAGCSAVIHNGVIQNSDEMFTSLKLERKAEPDTDIARAVFDTWGLTERSIEKLSKGTGSGAIAAVHPDYPSKLLLIRSGNPLTIASNEDFFYFSSEKATLHKACRPFVQRMGMWFQAQKPNVDFANMADNTGWIIGPKGLESHTECKICDGDYIEPWRKTYEEYEQRQQRWNNLKNGVIPVGGRKMGWCYVCKKEWWVPASGVVTDFRCNDEEGGCGGKLAELPAGKDTLIRMN